MANPVLTTCYGGEWNLVAESVLTGFLRQPLTTGHYRFKWTSRDTGETAPSDSDKTDGNLALPLFEDSRTEEIMSVNAQDFYVWVENADGTETGSTDIRVDL